MPQTSRFRLISMSRARLGLAAAAMFGIVIGIGLLAVDVMRQIEQESESRSDNAQWALSQIELELLHLVSAADSAHHGEIPLSALRLDYDIFYSRLTTLREGRVFAHLRETPEFRDSIQRLSDYMQRHLPFIDGPDAALYADLLPLRDEGRALIGDTRRIALTGVEVSAMISDQQRAAVTRTLIVTGTLIAVLFTFFVGLVILLLRLFRFNRLRAMENLATLSRLDAVVSTAMEALITLDAQGRIVDFNDAACQTFGRDRDEAAGTDMATLILPDGQGQSPFRTGAEPLVAGQGRFRVTARRKSGQVFPAEVSVSRVMSNAETLFVVFLRDLSAQVAAEQALVSARDRALAGEKAKAELLAVMSHEIRTPLNGMIGTIDLLDATPLTPQQREYLRILQASGRLLMHHVNDVLDITRLDSGKARLSLAPVDLAELVQEVIENQLPASRANGNAMVFHPPPDGRSRALADGALLRQVLLNLVGNAVKFTHDGTITVEIENLSDPDTTEIRVRDTGIGIAEADRDRIFDDFVTLDASYSRDASGTGLGLGIVRRIVAQMGGELALDSQPGQGSTFRIRLPLRLLPAGAPPQPTPAQPQALPPAARPLSVLVVEDNDFNRLILREMLRKEGHEVVEARDGAEGIALAQARAFDLILMDISMPQVDGLQATRAIRALQGASQAAPILAMTAHALQEETERFLAGGMTAVLVKPITREALAQALHRPPAPRAPAPAPEPEPAALDAIAFRQIVQDLGADRANSLLARFRAEGDAALPPLLAALSPGAPSPDEALIHLAHRLAGSAAMFGAKPLHRLLAEVETAWKARAPLDTPRLSEALSRAWHATRLALPEAPDQDRAQASSLR